MGSVLQEQVAQEGAWELEAWVSAGEVILTKLVAFYREVPSLMEKARAVHVAPLAFRKAQQATGLKKKIHAKHFLSHNI